MLKLEYLVTMLAIAALTSVGCSKNGASPRSEVAHAEEREPATPEPWDMPATDETAAPAAGPAPLSAPGVEPVAPEPIAGGGASKMAALSGGQIVQITDTINRGEIEQAKVAQTKSRNPEVKRFAAHMISEHGKAKRKGTALAKKQRLDLEQSPVALDISDKGSTALADLRSADADSFDQKYIDGQRKAHEEVLELLNARLIPSAADADLKALLEDARAMVESHLSKVRALQQLHAQDARK